MLKQTPDLTNEFHPVPKPIGRGKKEQKPIQPGEKTKEWADIRGELKAIFATRGIKECELQFTNCWKNNALTFAHIDKRRHLTKEDLYKVVLACVVCHEVVERMQAKDMRLLLLKTIENREQ